MLKIYTVFRAVGKNLTTKEIDIDELELDGIATDKQEMISVYNMYYGGIKEFMSIARHWVETKTVVVR